MKVNFYKKLYNWSLIVFSLIYILLIYYYNYKKNFFLHDGDNYRGKFLEFYQNGYYKSVSEGTSILYNLVIYPFYLLTKDIVISIFCVNSISHLLIIILSFKILKKFKSKNTLLVSHVCLVFFFYLINSNYFATGNNDIFLGVLIVFFFYIIFGFLNNEYSLKKNILLGLIIGLIFSTRASGIFIVPIYMLFCVVHFILNKNSIKQLVVTPLVALIVVFVFHFPSIVEKHKLSFEDKSPSGYSVNWIQRNYLGLKKIELGKENMHRDAIWKNTKFEEVQKYVDQNGDASLPKSFIEFITKDPILAIKITAYNIGHIMIREIRFFGFLFLVIFYPILDFFKEKKMDRKYFSVYAFYIFCASIAFLTLTFVEYRWFAGYEVLIPLSFLVILKDRKFNENKYYLVLSLNLIFITLANLKSLITLI